MKAAGATISILYIPYIQIANVDNGGIVATENKKVNGFSPTLATPLQSCATSGYFYTANTTDDITNALNRSQEQGGHRYGGLYTRVNGNLLFEIGANKHNGEVSQFSAIRESRNTDREQAFAACRDRLSHFLSIAPAPNQPCPPTMAPMAAASR